MMAIFTGKMNDHKVYFYNIPRRFFYNDNNGHARGSNLRGAISLVLSYSQESDRCWLNTTLILRLLLLAVPTLI